jgi:hypothetical protein
LRTVTTATTNAWQDPFKGGENRPIARATIQKLNVAFTAYDLQRDKTQATQNALNALSGKAVDSNGAGVFASLMFGQTHVPKELPNVRTVSWNRTLDADAAECTLTLWNTSPLPIGQAPAAGFEKDFDRLGWFTPDRGKAAANARWGTTANEWEDLLAPDRVIRTYEGYGFTPGMPPELDEHLYQTGCWLIDDVDETHDGIITVKCRDYARVLLDHIYFPPVVPWAEYKVPWEKYHEVDGPQIVDTKVKGAKWFRPNYDTDSNIPYIGKGFTDGGRPYVDGNGAVLGHHGRHAMDKNNDSYWLSVGNMPNWSSAYEYVQGSFSKRTISAVKVRTWGGPYTCYVSVKVGGKWLGGRRIPYRYRAVDTNADINYVKRMRVDKSDVTEIVLPKAYANATAVRVTFTDLYNSGIGYYKFRAGLKDLQVLQQSSTAIVKKPGPKLVKGNYGDYSDIVLWLLAWGGFFWPEPGTGQSFYTYSNRARFEVTPAPPRYNDPLPKGTIWGDWMPTGTYGIGLGNEIWDKKPLMDCIRYIKDIVSFNFFIDETGGVVWRMPNVFVVGNYLSGVDGGQHQTRTNDVVEIDEKVTLQGLRAVRTSKNVRERVFISSTDGKSGAVAEGYNPAPSGLRRVGGWTDQHFTTAAECQVMADFVTLRQMFAYRSNTITIPGYPAIQLDDQVRVYERTTAETYLHYVKGISSELDMTTGKWSYTLTTNWLGQEPGTHWAVDRLKLRAETKQYLKTLGVT